MAAAYDDDSTDDEIGMNLQLAERLNIRRGEYPQSSSDHQLENKKDYKQQYCNMHMQQYIPESSCSGIDSQKDCSFSTIHGPYIPLNKKRQNGDKNLEQFANPKRTCLNGRYPNCADRRDSKKLEKNDIRYAGSKFLDSLHQHPEQSTSLQDLYPDKTYEDHLNNLADAEDSDHELLSAFSYRVNDRSKGQSSRSLVNHAVSCSSGVCPEPYVSYQPVTKQGVQFIESCSDEDSKTTFRNGALKGGRYPEPYIPYQPVTRHGVQFIESGSDEDSKTTFRNGALKGGKQSPDLALSHRKVVGRKVKKVLDSDDTDDEYWESGYRSQPLVFSSTDSEDDSEKIGPLSENATSKHHANHSFSRKNLSPHCDHYSSRRQKSGLLARSHRRSPTKLSYNSASSFKTQNFSGDGCSSEFLASVTVPKELHGKNTNKLCRSHRSTRSNMPTSTIAENNYVSNISPPTSSMRGRNTAHGNLRGSRISVSPRPKTLHSRRQSDIKCSRNRSLSSTHSHQGKSNLAAAYPDLFDAEEDSSEVEFFTANSYSDTETSNESLRGLTINATFVNTSDSQNNREIICEHSVNLASSEDEISVVFSTAPSARSEQRRGGRALGRRYGKGTGHRHLPNNQEVVSLSPDPVEQVRQMEEDERFARMLQAEFDAELNAPRQPSVVPYENVWTDSDDSIIDPVGGSESEETTFNGPLLPFVQRTVPIHRRGYRIPNRFTSSTLGPATGALSRRRTEGRNRRNFLPSVYRPDARSWQRLLDILPSNILPPFESSEDDYETLLSFTELHGDVPRGLSRSEINRLPTRQYRSSNTNPAENADIEVSHKRTELNKECQVCLSDYVAGDVLRILPCFHEFHTPCIDPWLKINHTCPVCRVIVNLED